MKNPKRFLLQLALISALGCFANCFNNRGKKKTLQSARSANITALDASAKDLSLHKTKGAKEPSNAHRLKEPTIRKTEQPNPTHKTMKSKVRKQVKRSKNVKPLNKKPVKRVKSRKSKKTLKRFSRLKSQRAHRKGKKERASWRKRRLASGRWAQVSLRRKVVHAPKSTHSLDKVIIYRLLKKYKTQFQYCYQQFAKRGTLKISYQFTVHRGKIKRFRSRVLKAQRLKQWVITFIANCIQRKMYKIRFPIARKSTKALFDLLLAQKSAAQHKPRLHFSEVVSRPFNGDWIE